MVGKSYFNHRKRKVSKISAGGRIRKNNQALSYLSGNGQHLVKLGPRRFARFLPKSPAPMRWKCRPLEQAVMAKNWAQGAWEPQGQKQLDHQRKDPVRDGNGGHLVKLGRRRFDGSPRSFRGPCRANAVPVEHANMSENWAREPASLRAKSSWIIDGSTRYVMATVGIWSNWVAGDLPVSPKIPGKHAVKMPSRWRKRSWQTIERWGLRALWAKAAGSSTEAPGTSQQRAGFGQTGSPEICWMSPKSPGPMPCKCRPGGTCGHGEELSSETCEP